MSSKEQKPAINPVVIVVLGVAFIAIALILFVFPNGQSLNLNAGAGSWSQLVVAFITGITTGGFAALRCRAVCWQVLLHIRSNRIMLSRLRSKNKKASVRSNSAFPIFFFLVSKLIAYTLLGALLGWLGSFLTLSPMTRAMLMIAIGIFMIGNALRMFNVHPIFRYFSVEPPKFITRYIRRTAKGTDTFTPLFLGALTVFIPCGVTQAMMATALGTGSVVMGAALMFAFLSLALSPLSFSLLPI
ncbi:MAG: sulfite exporter TauE/SafE family protein [Anaerolineales bacterium]|uniref:sulfite exporter TauE/SafE family protein n=1 Tax=Candidatus Villigracilis proximus TaxID=3140683 RepID=UPI00313624F6|nr:sulfite exporter TauE/SafE family protein [Anaerolineales bacterium]